MSQATTQPEAESKPKVSLMQRFRNLPPGVQRLIIGVLVIVLLLATNFVRTLISAEEEERVAHDTP